MVQADKIGWGFVYCLHCAWFVIVLVQPPFLLRLPLTTDHQRYSSGSSYNLVTKNRLLLWYLKYSLPSRARKGEVCPIFTADLLNLQVQSQKAVRNSKIPSAFSPISSPPEHCMFPQVTRFLFIVEKTLWHAPDNCQERTNSHFRVICSGKLYFALVSASSSIFCSGSHPHCLEDSCVINVLQADKLNHGGF